MHAHGSETYYVLGEGELSESGDGRASGVAPDAALARTASSNGTGSREARLAATPPFRFTRMGPQGRPLSERINAKIARAMISPGGGATGIPAGFTYLGQFVDHDLTFDKTQVMLGEAVSPADLLQGRSPSLDLDSLYGAGPLDEASARFYADDRHLKTGRTNRSGPDQARDGFDLPRGAGTNRRSKRRAVIPDPRNDENLAVAQTQLAMMRFHNRVVDKLPASTPAAARFSRARRGVVKHYQWMIRHDYLPRICRASVLNDVFDRGGRKVFEVDAAATDVPTMPIEFSVAAFRIGHSMIRSTYSWNRRFSDGGGSLDLLFLFSGTSGDLGGAMRLPNNWICDFHRLYPFAELGRDDLDPPSGQRNLAMRIDTRLVDPLKNLPTGSFGGPGVPFDDRRANLAFRNLMRANMVKLATGQQMAELMRERGVKVTSLTRAQILEGRNGAQLDGLTSAEKDALVVRTPLWFYVLREAEFNRGKLDGVGARIIAETFHRAMEGSSSSIVRDADWRPTFAPDRNTFRMIDLLLFAFEGKKRLLNPLGP